MQVKDTLEIDADNGICQFEERKPHRGAMDEEQTEYDVMEDAENASCVSFSAQEDIEGEASGEFHSPTKTKSLDVGCSHSDTSNEHKYVIYSKLKANLANQFGCTSRDSSTKTSKSSVCVRLSVPSKSQDASASRKSDVDQVMKVKESRRAKETVRKQERKRTFQNQKHKITFSLFLVCFCFIVIIVPQTSIQLINYFTDKLPVKLILNIYSITELIYLLNFVVNPIIFTYNNGYLMDKLNYVIKRLRPKRRNTESTS